MQPTVCCRLLSTAGWASWQAGEVWSRAGPTAEQNKQEQQSDATDWRGLQHWWRGLGEGDSQRKLWEESVCKQALNFTKYTCITQLQKEPTRPGPGPPMHIKPVLAEVNPDCTRYFGSWWNSCRWLLPTSWHQQETTQQYPPMVRHQLECSARGIKEILH